MDATHDESVGRAERRAGRGDEGGARGARGIMAARSKGSSSRRAGLARALGLGAALGALAVTLGGSAMGCSAIVDKKTAQCAADGDCAALGLTGSCVEGVCQVAAAGECTTTAECIEKLGDFHICRKSTQTCVSLTSEDCTTIVGNYQSDSAIFVGAVAPTMGSNEGTGISTQNGVKLAISDFDQTANGLPPIAGSTARRPLVLVGCNDGSDADTAVRAAQHLVDEVGVPAIIGAAFSGITIKMATEVTIPAGVLALSPSATSVAITDLADNGLVWRTSPSDVFQADALAAYVPLIEAEVREQLAMAPGDKVKVFIAHKGDAYGNGLAQALEQKLVMNGAPALDISNGPSYERFNFGNPDDPTVDPTKYGEAVAGILALEPHIVLLLGTTETVTDLLGPIEQGWPVGAPYRPVHLGGDGFLVPELWGLVGADDDLRRRCRGTVPGTTGINFQAFAAEYNSKFQDGSPDVFGAAGGYDALYLIAYAAVAAGDTPLTGAVLAENLKKMVAGQSVKVGSSSINSTFPILQSGQDIDFDGASGPLDFNVDTGEAPSDIQIWCMPIDGQGNAASGVSSGLAFIAATGTLEGTIGPQCN